jgi:hypothetical protein
MISANFPRKVGELKRSKLRGRSGGMLILVLIIMAVGVILITSAMSITIASRNRYYSDTISGQARLTATAAVKSIVGAVETQEIRDIEIEALAANNATLTITAANGTSKSSGAGTGNSIAPGIATAANSFTQATFSYYPNATAKTYVVVDVVTGLTANGATTGTEHVRAFLKYNPPTAGTVDAFGAMVTAGGDGASNVFRNFVVGQGATAGASSNYVILHGNFNVGEGTIKSYGDVVYTGLVAGASGVTYSGDIVFYGDKAGITGTSGDAFNAQGSLLFIGEDPALASVFRNTDGSKRSNTSGLAGGVKGLDGIYFYNTSFISSQGEGFYPASSAAWNIFVDGTSTFKETMGYVHTGTYGGENPNVSTNDKMIKLSSTSTVTYNSSKTINVVATQSAKFTGDIKTAAQKYMSADWEAAAERKVPTTAQAISMTGYSASSLTSATLLSGTALTTNGTYTAGAYKINASAGTAITGELEFDLTNNDITLYIYGSGTQTIGANNNPGLIKFTNGGAHWGRIILVQNVNLKLVEDYTSGVDNGILSTPHTAPDQIATSASGKPYLYIIGLGGNKVDAYQFSRIEGYIGMYGNPSVTATDSAGSILFHNGPYAYGRFEAINLGNPADTGGSFINLYYCPGPNDPDGGTGKEAIKSNYTIEGYEYYS